ncbi:MAG: hypothetical protein KAJ25_12190, partial [Desulfobacula sp.]|nr:hypothetical protein [Desulfobacula sp.]
MMSKSNIILLTFAGCFIFLIVACDDPPQTIKKSAPTVVSGKIIQPVVQNKPEKPEKIDKKIDKKIELNSKKDQISETNLKVEDSGADAVLEQEQEIESVRQEKEHYYSQGKIDPFKPLIQDKPEESR